MAYRAKFISLRRLMVLCGVGVSAMLLWSPFALATKKQAIDRASTAAAIVESHGYTCRREIEMMELEHGESFLIRTTFYEGHVYAVIGAGDNGIRDLDLELYDSNFNLLDKDDDVNPVPVVEGWAVRRGQARVNLKVVAYSGSGWATAVICHKKR